MQTNSTQGWEVKSSTGNHFDVLDGLRGIAILLVVMLHTFYTNPDHGVFAWALGYFITVGWVGVPIFFVLSGFLISQPFFSKRHTHPQFWYPPGYARRRIGKIVPPFYFSILFFIVFYWIRFQDPAYLYSAGKWALWLGNFISIKPLFNGPYWSLMVEAQFYLLLPLLFLLTRGSSSRNTALILFALLFLAPLITRQLTWPAGLLVMPDWDNPVALSLNHALDRFPCHLDYFAYGVLFAGLYAALGQHTPQLRALGLLGYLGIGLLLLYIFFWCVWSHEYDIRAHQTRWSLEFNHLLPGLAGFFLLFFVFDPECLGSKILGFSWLRFIGIVSFEWFLFHWPFCNLMKDKIGYTHGSLALFLLKTVFPLALSFGLAVVVYRWFSLPILNRVRQSVKRQTA
jgi:peptidoglycan/LPS O-acetylase OafA/YrhL